MMPKHCPVAVALLLRLAALAAPAVTPQQTSVTVGNSWLQLATVGSLAAVPAGASSQTSVDDATALDWSHGSASWQQVSRAQGHENLWAQPNYCDARVLRASAPLTVLFGVSKFWSEIQQRRASLAQTSASTSKPLEVHVLGSAYPFEGRSDWSLLASRRPPDVPGVRVVLVLGTPWHQDNVPVMQAQEFDETRSFLLQLGVTSRKPETGKMRDGAMHCRESSNITAEDKIFKKEDLCRDHGNGLEVVCVEKYYQEVSATLPKPDIVVMFSPGFPQIARRSWDQVLRSLLEMDVPVMVGDLLRAPSVEKIFKTGASEAAAAPGSNWLVKPSRFEDGMSLRAMHAYGAHSLGAFRNPFPIFINRGAHQITAKNAVVQVFRGRLEDAKALELPTAKAIEERKKVVAALDLEHSFEDDVNREEIKSSMLIPTSYAYDRAMWKTYRAEMRSWVQHRLRKRKWARNKRMNKAWMQKVEELGLTGKLRKKPWSLHDWVFILTKLKGVDAIF